MEHQVNGARDHVGHDICEAKNCKGKRHVRYERS